MVSSGNLVGQAYQTRDLFVYVDAGDLNSYNPASPGVWRDLSGNERDGAIAGAPTLVSSALTFRGGTSSSAIDYVDMGTGYSDFGSGITIEAQAHFGSSLGAWERIFDFGNGSMSDNFWLGRYFTSDEIAVEVWIGSTNQGRCRTADEVNAIPSSTTLKKFTVTLDGSVCKIYIDGVQVNTVVDGPMKGTVAGQNSTYDNFYDDAALSSPYTSLPANITRNNNYIGKSNWGGDAAFEGAVGYLRIYSAPLTAQSIEQNTNSDTPSFTITYSTTGSDSGSAPAQFTGNGSVSLAANTGSLEKAGYEFVGWATSANQTTAIPSTYNLAADITLYPVFRVVGSSDRGGGGGAPSEPALQVISPDQANGGNQPAKINPGMPHTIFGNGLDGVIGLWIGDQMIDITNKARDRLQVTIPKNLPAGKYRIQLVGNFGTVTQENFFEVTKKRVRQTSFGFAGNSPRLTIPIRASVRNLLSKLPGQVTLVCVGSTSNSIATDFDRKLATQRAKRACNLASQINPELQSEIRINPASGLGPRARSVKLILKNY